MTQFESPTQKPIASFAQTIQDGLHREPEKAEGRIGRREIADAMATLQEYKNGKAALERRIIDNELWFKMGHWKQYENKMMAEKAQPSSGWLFNSIANKHADVMDNYPEPDILPRAADDAETARQLSSILPVVLERCDYEQVYSDTWWYKLKQGTGVKGVFWDNKQNFGLGDISIKKMDLLMLFWEPGIMDIQDSSNFFSVSLEDNKKLRARYPDLRGHTGKSIDVATYLHDDAIDTSDKSLVVDWYYKIETNNQTILHYCKFCNGTVLYASENDPAYAQRGFYDHGLYPFVFDTLFVEEDTPAGFGYIDIMKDCQTSIDKLNHVLDENAMMSAKPRYFLADNTGVNEDELADCSRDIVHFTGRLTDENFRQLPIPHVGSFATSYMNQRVEELKETSGNRDFSQGSTTSGVTAASAIAALQEAGSKLSRDMLKSAYRSFVKECTFCIELMRQFYTEDRVFRVLGASNQNEFVHFSNQGLQPQWQGQMAGVDLGSRVPVFDIKVSAARKTTYSRLAQNETAKELYRLGMFLPENATQAMMCLKMMEFEGIETVKEDVQQNGTLAQQVAQMQDQMMKMAAVIDAQNGSRVTGNMAQAFGAQQPGRVPSGGAAGAKTTTNSLGDTREVGKSQADTAAQKAREGANPSKGVKR